MLQQINRFLHRTFNLINCEIRIDEVNINFIGNRLRGISQAAVISVSPDNRPTFRTGEIGGEVGR